MVHPATPTLASVFPTKIERPGLITLELRGSNFESGYKNVDYVILRKSGSNDIRSTDIEMIEMDEEINPSLLIATFNTLYLDDGLWDVVVGHDYEDADISATLVNAITVDLKYGKIFETTANYKLHLDDIRATDELVS